MEDTVWLDFDEKRHDTGRASLFIIDKEEFWIPNSVIKDEDEIAGGSIRVEVPIWWAEKEGLL